ncbi:universal stress protein [Pendulispora brunnea]|uniref:Universal stress protein n=1 Tax=Pendulispora brunnea TaxID=2905690 RepID=A0ABZ2KC83_9BACT
MLLCATDLTETSRHALDTALELAPLLRCASLHVLHVHETVERIDSVQHEVDRWDELKRELETYVATEIDHARRGKMLPAELSVSTAVRYGKAYREILRYAADVHASWIVVGTHGRTGLGHVLGSVAEHVVRLAPRTVIVAKSPEVCALLARNAH